MITLSIILVNYKAPQVALDCLRTLFPLPAEMEVIVVDNDSGDNSEALICGAFPQVKWVQMDYNSGFARGNNAGIRVSQGSSVLLLNSDTLVEENAVVRCYEAFERSGYIGCGVQLLNPDRTPQISGNYFMKGGLNHLMSLPYAGRFIRWIGLQMKVKKTNLPEATGVVEVDWINGAFLMVKKSAIEKAGLLDEDFFLYSEEIEWCYRLGKTGKMCIYGDLHVVHLMGVTANQAFDSSTAGYQQLSDRKGAQLMLSGLLRIRKQFGLGWFFFHLLSFWGTIPVYFIALLLRTLFFSKGIGNEWKNFGGFVRNVWKTSEYAVRIMGNRRYFYKII